MKINDGGDEDEKNEPCAYPLNHEKWNLEEFCKAFEPNKCLEQYCYSAIRILTIVSTVYYHDHYYYYRYDHYCCYYSYHCYCYCYWQQ